MSRNALLRSIIVVPGTSIRAAVQTMQDSKVKIILVCGERDVLLGTVTDGDIRRAVLRGIDLDGTVETIMNRNSKVSHRNDNLPALRAYMRETVIRHLPIVDDHHRVIDLVLLDAHEDVVEQDAMVVLMAGGRGSRLMPMTENTPKPLLKVGSKALIERQIEYLVGLGFRRVCISLNYLGHMIEEFFGDGSQFSIEIDYVREEKPLGTAGALTLIPPQQQPIVVMNGDILTKANLPAMLAYFRDEAVMATMGVREYLYTVPYGCVRANGVVIEEIEEKPTFRHLINAGIYVLSPQALQMLQRNEHCDMPHLFNVIVRSGGTANTFQITEEWIDVGQKEDLLWAQRLFAVEDKLD